MIDRPSADCISLSGNMQRVGQPADSRQMVARRWTDHQN